MSDQKKHFTSKEALAFCESKEWENWTDEQLVRLQLFQDKLCIPFKRYHEAISNVLNRSIYTHEFAFPELLIKEYLGDKEPPSFEEILNLIPEEKRLVIITEK